MSTGNRITKPGYEFYQPVIAACQFGLNQIAPHFYLHHLVENRADLPDQLSTGEAYRLFSDLTIDIRADLEFTYSARGFESWWQYWRRHIFRCGIGSMMRCIAPALTLPAEAVSYLFHFISFQPCSENISPFNIYSCSETGQGPTCAD